MEQTSVSDGDLVQQAQAGNREAFGMLFERHKDAVYNWLLYETHDPDKAEEFTAEAFRRAYQALPRQETVNNFKAWVQTIGRNAFFDECRKRGRETSFEEDIGEMENKWVMDVDGTWRPEADGTWQPEAAARVSAIKQLVWDGIAMLPDKYRWMLESSVRGGWEADEIARRFGLQRGTVYTRLSRARVMLEENVTLLVVVKVGRRACRKLDDLAQRIPLKRATRAQRRALLRHIEGCSVCQETRRRHVTAEKLLALLPPVAAPPSLTLEKALGDAVSAGTADAAGQAAASGARTAGKGLGMKLLAGAALVGTVITAGVIVTRLRPAGATLDADAARTALDALAEVESYTLVAQREDVNSVIDRSAEAVITSTVNGADYSCVYETELGRQERYVVEGRLYSGGVWREATVEERTNAVCLSWVSLEMADVTPPSEAWATWYEWVGRERVVMGGDERAALHYRAEVDGAFPLAHTIAGTALDFGLDDLACVGTESLWLDEEREFLLRYTAEIVCRGAGDEWRTRQSIAVTEVEAGRPVTQP
jgi:RNA polymerase sigma factor (sigma-70 family)